jgi:hypothetical protein
MKIHKKLRFLLVVTAIFLAVIFVSQGVVKAAGLSALSVILQDGSGNNLSDATTAVPNTFVNFTPSTGINTDDGIQINFASDFDISDVVDGDVALAQGTSPAITKGTAAVDGQDLQIPITTESDTPDGAVAVSISGSHITTPTTPGTYTVTVTTWDLGDDGAFGGTGADLDVLEDTGAAAIVIGTNTVNIYGTVDPTLSLALSANSCDLGTLSITNIKTCQYNTTVSTNGHNGYNAYIVADGDLRNGATSITNVGDGTVTPASEEYGVSTTDSGRNISIINDANSDTFYTSADCTALNNQGVIAMDASALSTSDKTFGHSSGPVSSSVFTMCHAAGITGTTPAGSYNQLVTITVVAGF